jgi:hypothetical protein
MLWSFVYLAVELIHYPIEHVFYLGHLNPIVIFTDILLMDDFIGFFDLLLEILDCVPENFEKPTEYCANSRYSYI